MVKRGLFANQLGKLRVSGAIIRSRLELVVSVVSRVAITSNSEIRKFRQQILALLEQIL